MAVKTAGALNFQRQLDVACPLRKRPDGWLGDQAHKRRRSSHNADDTPGSRPAWDGDPDNIPEVRALDISADLGPGVDSQDLVDHLVRLTGLAVVIRYVIHRGLIYHADDGFDGEFYDGDNPHDEHVHIEFAWTQAADNNETYDYRLEEIAMPSAAQIVDELLRRELANGKTVAATLVDIERRTGSAENTRLPRIEGKLDKALEA